MSLPVSAILRASKKRDKYNILDFVTHERYQTILAKTGHNFFLLNLKAPGIKESWNENYGKIPTNYTLLPHFEGTDIAKIAETIPHHLEIDCIISHQKFGQYQIAKPLSRYLHVPLLQMEHTLPLLNWPKSRLEECRFMNGHTNLFITKFNQKVWGYDSSNSEVITHAVDTEVFKPSDQERQNTILTVANDYINRNMVLNFNLYKQLTNGLPTRPVGDTPGFSKGTTSTEELANIYQTSSIFLNTANWSPVPMSMLEAMACGCAVVTVDTCSCSDYIENGENGFICNNPDQLKLKLMELLANKSLREKLGAKARETILEKCSLERFVKEWNKLLDKTANTIYRG